MKAMNFWPGWSDFLARSEKPIENRLYGVERFDIAGGLPLTVAVFATARVDVSSFSQAATVLGRATSDLYWRPWVASAIIGEITIVDELRTNPTTPELSRDIENEDICARHLPDVDYRAQIKPWGQKPYRDENGKERIPHWFLVANGVRYPSPIPWSSRQAILVDLPDDIAALCRQERARAANDRPSWSSVARACHSCQRSHTIQMAAPRDGFECGGCGRTWRLDGSEVRPGGKKPRFKNRCLSHDYRAVPYPDLDRVETTRRHEYMRETR